MPTERRLVAILFTDIVGSTAVTARSESAGLALRDRHRELVRTQVERYRGRFVEAPGDESLSTFESAVDAVHAALAIQQELGGDPELQVRIGLHLGETMFRGDEVFGDGVNIAARVRALAEPGQILGSSEVAHAVQNQPHVHASLRGEHQLKGVDRPISIHAISGTVVAPDLRETGQKSAPISAIAVLPLDDLSPDGDQKWLAGGITEDLIESLSRISQLRVIARTSAERAKATGEEVRSIGERLHVGSIVEGSARRVGDQIRVTAQLILVADESHLWSGRYDASLDDVFAVQARIAREIAEAIRHKLGIEEESWLTSARYSPKDARAYEQYRRACELWKSDYSREALEQAERHLEKALEIEPTYAAAHEILAWNHWYLFQIHGQQEHLTPALAAAQRAVEIDGRKAAGSQELLLEMRIREEGYFGVGAQVERALESMPGWSGLRIIYARTLAAAGRFEDALIQARRAIDLDPLVGDRHGVEGLIHLYQHHYGAAIASLERASELDPRFWYPLATAYHLAGDDQRAVAVISRQQALREIAGLEAAVRDGYAAGGWIQMHRALLAAIAARTGRPPSRETAVLHAAADDAEGMFRCLERWLKPGGPDPLELRWPEFDPYRDAPRFQDVFRRAGLVD
jgi:TolB-like protein/Flp pilus assembly protein TadD